MVVGRGNDAIPTWSGFNYQGKMMLLYVLELINQIAKDKNKDIGTYSVELEKTEDFCIICNSEYRSFHQVKAYLSKDKWNSYSEAMDKLLKHRAESNNPAAKCYLTVAREIKDWDDASNTYNVCVELYKRASKIVGVCDVRNEINTEILEYLRSKGYSDKTEEVVYGELCLFLDDSIARMHKQDSKKRKYIIKFSDIVGVMESAIDKEDVRKEYFLKEKIYEYVMQNIEKALNNLCHDECDTFLENCNRVCAAKCGYEKMTAGRDEIILNDTEDVLTQICRQYMKWGQCPRFMNTEKIIERQEYVDAIAKEYKADGLIYQQIKFCDYWGYERASAFHVMKEKYGYPVLSIDRPYAVGTSGQLRTRIQAFVESLEIKRINAGRKL